MNNNDTQTKLRRLRTWFFALLIVVVFAGSIGPIAVFQWLQSRVDEVQFDISCSSARANVSQLEALHAIARELGIPALFPIPEVPPECE
jgi:nitrate/TMAO reductase-like tetraheme cytochrome c subunit